MTGSTFADVVKFTATAGGTASFAVASAITGFQTPATAAAVSGNQYSYRAESTDLTQWEVGQGTYTSSNTTITRTPLFNSAAGSSAINFTLAPNVGFVALNEDLLTANITKAIQQTATSNVAGVTPLHQQDHPSAAKAWVNFAPGVSPTINGSYNVATVTRTAAGDYTVNYSTAFTGTTYAVCTSVTSSNSFGLSNPASITSSNVRVQIYNTSGALGDPTVNVMIIAAGTQ